jgi:putative sterol carrier protein
MIEEVLVSVVERFNRHVQKNPAVLKELKDMTRSIEIHFTDGKTYHLALKDAHLSLPAEGDGAKADVKITTDSKTFEGLVNKDIGPMKALFTRKLFIDATLEDKLLLRRLF